MSHHMGGVPVATSELVGTFLEAIGYGIYLMITPQVVNVTLRKKDMRSTLRAYFLITTLLIFICATVHLTVDLSRAFLAFTSNMSTPHYPEAYFANVNTGWNLTKNSTYICTTIVADALLVYRTFVVWGRNVWVTIVPALILFADFGLSVWFNWSINEARPGNSVLVSTVFIRSKYFLVATLVLNLLCTFLISFRIWKIQSSVLSFKSTRGANALSIIVESAAIYSAVTVVLIICSITGASPFFFFLNSMPPLIGVVFSYIIIRSSTDDHRKYDTTVMAITTIGGSIAGDHNTTSQRSRHYQSNGTRSQNADEGVHIHLQRVVHRDDVENQCTKSVTGSTGEEFERSKLSEAT